MGLWLLTGAAGVAWLVMGVAWTAAALIGAILIRFAIRWWLPRRPRSMSRTLLGLPVAGAGTLVMGVAFLLPAFRGIDTDHLLRTLPAGAALARPAADSAWQLWRDLAVTASVIAAVLISDILRRPGTLGAPSLDAVTGRAQAIVAAHGEDSLSPYVLRPDKHFELTDDGLVAFVVIRDTVVISADPVGSPAGAAEALRRLITRAREAGLGVACYGASTRFLPVFEQLGMGVLCAGEEAVVVPADFSLEGRSVRKLRQSVGRIERRGWTVSVHVGRDIGTQLEGELDAVEARWREEHPRLLGFAMSMGHFDLPIRPDDLYVLARSPEGELCGMLRFLAHADKLSLDVMRRVGETPNGLIEALVCRALTHAREAGVAEVSLNYAGLAHLLRTDVPEPARTRAWLRRLLRPLRSRFQMDRLIDFNEKFSPQWRPRYLVYDSPRRLPRAIYRVLQAEGYLAANSRRTADRLGRPEPGWRPLREGAGR